MTMFDDEAALFADITQGVTFDTFEPALDDLPLVLMDGKPVRLNAFEGEDLRSQLTDSYAIARHDMQEMGLMPDEDRRAAGEYIAKALERVLVHDRQGDDIEEMFALQGVGLFGVSTPEVDLTPDLLVKSQTLFGILSGVAYGEYWRGDPSELEAYIQGSGSPKVTNHGGALLFMTDVIICRTAETYGPVDRTYDVAFIPTQVHDLRFYKAYPQS